MKLRSLLIWLALILVSLVGLVVIIDGRLPRQELAAQGQSLPRVSSIPFTYDIALGTFPERSSINKFGHNSDVGASLETIWSGSNIYPYLAAADQLEIQSADADDTSGGTGARTLELFGLDGSYSPISEIVTLNGATFVTTSDSFLRIFRAIVRSAGSSGWNEGVITIRDQDTDTTRALIEVNVNQTLMATYTVPAGQTAYITFWYAGSSFAKDTHIQMYVRPEGEVFQIKRYVHLFRQTYQGRLDFPEAVAEKSDIEIRAQASGGSGEISGGFFLWLEEN